MIMVAWVFLKSMNLNEVISAKYWNFKQKKNVNVQKHFYGSLFQENFNACYKT